MGATNITRSLAEFASGLRADALPADILNEAKRLTLDAIGNAIGGAQTEIGAVTERFIEGNAPRGAAPVIGSDISTSAAVASYGNGRLSDIIDASDTFMTVHHIGAPVVMAALALGAERDVSGADFLAAVAAGLEVGARIGSAAGAPRRASSTPGMPPNFPSPRLPVEELAAAVGAARVVGLDADRICDTIGIAAANAPRHATHWGVGDPLPDQKYQDYGVTSQTGVTAALLAETGMRSHPDTLMGPPGLWRLCGVARCDFELMVGGLGSKWFLANNAYKPWPACKWTQYPLTAFDAILKEHRLTADEIDRIDVQSHVFGTAAYFRNTRPSTMISCAFNYPHAIAMMALRVPPGPWWYSPAAVNDPKVRRFRERVHVRTEPYTEISESSMVDGQLRELPTRVTVFARGREFAAEVVFARGDPFSQATRFSDDDLFEKFLYMGSARGRSDSAWLAQAQKIRGLVWDLHRLPQLRSLTNLLSRSALGLQSTSAADRSAELATGT